MGAPDTSPARCSVSHFFWVWHTSVSPLRDRTLVGSPALRAPETTLPGDPPPLSTFPRVKYKFIKTTFIKKSSFIKIHFHQKPLSSKTTFIKNHFHQNPISSKTNFIHVDTFIKKLLHQKPERETRTLTTPDGSDQMKATAENYATLVCSTHAHETRNCATLNVADMEGLTTSSCNWANSGTKRHGKARHRCEGIENVIGLVAHDHDEPRQQATVEQEKTMLTQELSRLKGAPSTCVCSVRRTQE